MSSQFRLARRAWRNCGLRSLRGGLFWKITCRWRRKGTTSREIMVPSLIWINEYSMIECLGEMPSRPSLIWNSIGKDKKAVDGDNKELLVDKNTRENYGVLHTCSSRPIYLRRSIPFPLFPFFKSFSAPRKKLVSCQKSVPFFQIYSLFPKINGRGKPTSN